MEDYSLALALFDYLPVALSLIGLLWVVRLLASVLPSTRPALLVGLGLVVLGGASKATWKLTWVLAGADLALLDNALFVCIAPGMVLLACHAVAADRRWCGSSVRLHPLRNGLLAAIALLGVGGLAAVSFDNRAWFFVLLAGASLANLVLAAMLIRCSLRWRQGFTAAIFLVSLLITLSLGGLARFSAGSAPLQWLAEILNAFATGSFAWAAWRLLRAAATLPDAGSPKNIWIFGDKA